MKIHLHRRIHFQGPLAVSGKYQICMKGPPLPWSDPTPVPCHCMPCQYLEATGERVEGLEISDYGAKGIAFFLTGKICTTSSFKVIKRKRILIREYGKEMLCKPCIILNIKNAMPMKALTCTGSSGPEVMLLNLALALKDSRRLLWLEACGTGRAMI
jgi:hypothetical protein